MKTVRQILYDRQKEITTGMNKEYELLEDQLRNSATKINNQLKKESKAKIELLHPYMDAIHEILQQIDIARICLEYIPTQFCTSCNSIYFGNACISCVSPCGYVTYRIQSEMIIECHHDIKITDEDDEYGSGFITYCYRPSNCDDEELIMYWKNHIKNNNNDRVPFCKASELHIPITIYRATDMCCNLIRDSRLFLLKYCNNSKYIIRI